MNMSADESIQAMKKIVAISIAGAAAALVATWRKVRADSSPVGEWSPADPTPSRPDEATKTAAAARDSGAASSSPATQDTGATQGPPAAETPSTPAEESTPADVSAPPEESLPVDESPVADEPAAADGGPVKDAGSASEISAGSSKAELYEVAQRLGIEGRSKMNKQQLLEAIRAAG